MRLTKPTLRDSFFGWLMPSAAVVDPKNRADEIRELMLEELLGESGSGFGALASRIHAARDVEALWYQRTALMQALSHRRGEAHARATLDAITARFDGVLPRTMTASAAPAWRH